MNEINRFIEEAIECSIYVSPRDIGLTPSEILEAAKQVGFRSGETEDALAPRLAGRFTSEKCIPAEHQFLFGSMSADFNTLYDPDFRDFEAFAFVRREMLELAKEVRAVNAVLPRDTLVERGVAKGLDRHALDIATTITVLAGAFKERDGMISPANTMYALPTQQISSGRQRVRTPRPTLLKTHTIVRDIVERRTDGRPKASDPLDAFELCLSTIGHERFRAWWIQQRAELRLAGPSQPTTQLVLAASLAEAALAFVVPRVHKNGLMTCLELAKPRTWRFDDLIKGAKSSNPTLDPILDDPTAVRALQLNGTRQRIHAGYLIDQVPNGPVPDLRPEQAKDGIQTAELLIRKVVDWLSRHPS
jgi:hypothetical protein